MVGPDGLEPSTPRLSSACSNQLSYEPEFGNWQYLEVVLAKLGGVGRSRTDDPLLAKQVLYQLSYDPKKGNLYKEHTLEIYFVRSTETRKLSLPSTMSSGFLRS
jgi:hypothetical protein